MIAFGTTVLQLLALATPWLAEVPQSSAAVVEATFARYSIADGLESCFVTLKVKKGWHVYANPTRTKEEAAADAKAGVKPRPAGGVACEFLLDGMSASVCDIWYPPGVVQTDALGNKYRAYEGERAITVWLIWDETMNAKVLTARVKVVATDGKRTLKPAVLTAETR
jgi:hypothetical protein